MILHAIGTLATAWAGLSPPRCCPCHHRHRHRPALANFLDDYKAERWAREADYRQASDPEAEQFMADINVAHIEELRQVAHVKGAEDGIDWSVEELSSVEVTAIDDEGMLLQEASLPLQQPTAGRAHRSPRRPADALPLSPLRARCHPPLPTAPQLATMSATAFACVLASSCSRPAPRGGALQVLCSSSDQRCIAVDVRVPWYSRLPSPSSLQEMQSAFAAVARRETLPRPPAGHLHDTSTTPPRHLHDTSTTPLRHLRDTSRRRHVDDTSTTRPRHLRGASTTTTRPRHVRDTSTTRPRRYPVLPW